MHTDVGKIRLRRFVFRPSGTLGEPHAVTVPLIPLFHVHVPRAFDCTILRSAPTPLAEGRRPY